MASNRVASYDRHDSFGLTWADQWDYNEEKSAKDGSNKGKIADYNKKMKSAASTGFDKAKSAATSGAKKVKQGAFSGVRWIKGQYEKRTKK